MGDGGLTNLGRVTENILVLCVEEHGLFNERDGHVLTVHVAAAVNSVAADEGIVDLRELLEVGRGLIADYRAGMAADDAAAYMNLEPRTAREIVRRLHGVGVYDAVRDIGKKIAQLKDGSAAAERDGFNAVYHGARLYGDAALLGHILMKLTVKGLVRDTVDRHDAAIGADDEPLGLHDRKLLAKC